MAGKEDFYSAENLESILAAMEDNLFEQNEDFSVQIGEVVGELGENQHACSLSCDQCDKICKTQRGFIWHLTQQPKNITNSLLHWSLLNNGSSHISVILCLHSDSWTCLLPSLHTSLLPPIPFIF